MKLMTNENHRGTMIRRYRMSLDGADLTSPLRIAEYGGRQSRSTPTPPHSPSSPNSHFPDPQRHKILDRIAGVHHVYTYAVRLRYAVATVPLEEVELLRAVALHSQGGLHPEIGVIHADTVYVRLVGEHVWEGDVVDVRVRVSMPPMGRVVKVDFAQSRGEVQQERDGSGHGGNICRGSITVSNTGDRRGVLGGDNLDVPDSIVALFYLAAALRMNRRNALGF